MNTTLKNSGIGNSISNTDSITVELHDKITKTLVVLINGWQLPEGRDFYYKTCPDKYRDEKLNFY